jgi:DNA-binding ferritin-like protein
MNVNNSGTKDGQENEQQPMQGPPAASQRDVEEAEKKADEARARAQALEEALDELQEDYEALREEHEETMEVVDEHLDYIVENAKFSGFGSPEKTRSVKDAVRDRAAKVISPNED